MQLTSISGNSFAGTAKTSFSYNFKQPLKVIASHKDGEYFAKVGDEYYTIIGSGTCKETALNDLYLEFHFRVVDLKKFDKSISGFKKAYDFISKYINF
jgi:hypothetical protein